MIYSSLLHILSNKDKYYRFIEYIKPHILPKEIYDIISAMKSYYKLNPSLDDIDFDGFITWYKIHKISSLSKEKHAIYDKIFDTLETSPPTEDEMLRTLDVLLEKDYSIKISDVALRVSEGDDTKSILDVEEMLDTYKRESSKLSNVDNLFAEFTLDDILDNHMRDGLEWRMEELNISLGPMRGGDFMIVTSRPDSGKCLAPDTRVLLANGEVRLAKYVKVGDVLAGPHMHNTVQSTCSGREQMYRIQYKNGDYYDVNAPHVLSLKRSKAEGKHKVGDILNVPVEEYIAWPEGRKARYKGWKSGLDFEHKSLSGHVDPYILGLWLGDGHSANTCFTTADEEVVQALESYACKLSQEYDFKYYCKFVTNQNTGRASTYNITHSKKGVANDMRNSLRTLGILNDKHIPNLYKHNSEHVRKQVLAGLIDSDGSVSNGAGYEITQKNHALATDILDMLRSLGYSATMKEKKVKGTSYWRIHTYGDFSDLPLLLSYKAMPVPLNPKKKGLHFGFDVIPLGEGEYVGWELDGDRLFMLGDFTVTHNTTFLCSEATYMAEQLPIEKDIFWANNEEMGSKVTQRIYQAALGQNKTDMRVDKLTTAHKLKAALGRLDRFKLYDDKAMTVGGVNNALSKCNPGLIIFDQLWKVNGFPEAHNDVDKITKLFGWARELAEKYDCPVISVHQADGSASGVEYIEMNQMYGSKTGIQGEADAILGIGRSVDPSVGNNTRFLHISKNKLDGGARSDDKERNGKWMVEIQPYIARFKGVSK